MDENKLMTILDSKFTVLSNQMSELKSTLNQMNTTAQNLGYDSIIHVLNATPINNSKKEREIRAAMLNKWDEFLLENNGADVLKETIINRMYADMFERFKVKRVVEIPRLLISDVIAWIEIYKARPIDRYGVFSRNLMLTRVEKKHKMPQAAKEIGVSSQTIGSWELGNYCPHPRCRQSVAEYLGINVTQLDLLIDKQKGIVENVLFSGHDGLAITKSYTVPSTADLQAQAAVENSG